MPWLLTVKFTERGLNKLNITSTYGGKSGANNAAKKMFEQGVRVDDPGGELFTHYPPKVIAKIIVEKI